MASDILYSPSKSPKLVRNPHFFPHTLDVKILKYEECNLFCDFLHVRWPGLFSGVYEGRQYGLSNPEQWTNSIIRSLRWSDDQNLIVHRMYGLSVSWFYNTLQRRWKWVEGELVDFSIFGFRLHSVMLRIYIKQMPCIIRMIALCKSKRWGLLLNVLKVVRAKHFLGFL